MTSGRHLYPCKYLLLFYLSFAKSIMDYGKLIYASAAKTSLEKIESGQHRILKTIFFKTKFDFITDILLHNGNLTVFELYLSELLKKLLRQLRPEAPDQFLPEARDDSSSSRAQIISLLQPKYSRTVTKRKPMKIFLQKTYNWLTELKLIPSEL